MHGAAVACALPAIQEPRAGCDFEPARFADAGAAPGYGRCGCGAGLAGYCARRAGRRSPAKGGTTAVTGQRQPAAAT